MRMNICDPNIKNEWVIPEIRWDLEQDKFTDKTFNAGDEILFIPCISINRYGESDKETGDLKHVHKNLYEFNFKPIKKFCLPYKNKHCYHYLIEMSSGILVYHFNWKRKYKEYIKVDQQYWGRGRIKTCGNPSNENPFVPSRVIENIVQKAIIKKIFTGKYETYWGVELVNRG